MANEKRLIDANAFGMYLADVQLANRGWKDEICGFLDDVMLELDEQPTVDAVEVVHGRWLDNGMCNHKPIRFRNPDKWTVYKCSQCGYRNGRRKNANYCPNCGAKMDGDGK